MGDYAGFILRVEKPNFEKVKQQLPSKNVRDVHYEVGLGIITGIVKSNYPYGCVEEIKSIDFLTDYCILAETSNNGDGDCCTIQYNQRDCERISFDPTILEIIREK